MKNFLESDIIYLNIPTDDDWDSILDLMYHANVSVGDAIQVIAALASNCNVFITRDSDLVKVVKQFSKDIKMEMLVTDPKLVDSELEKIGIMPIFPISSKG